MSAAGTQQSTDSLPCETHDIWLIKTLTSWGWRDGSVVKSTDCSSRGPGFNSQHPHGSSQLSEDPVPGDLTLHTNAHKIKV
ncbi:hypothetical protein LEMLEM_LOCUS5939, partial [Lemmus lemmus]